MEEIFVGYEFFRGACGANGDFLDDARFDGNIDFDSGGNVGHVAFFKIVGGRDRVVEPVYMPRWDKIFSFDCVHGVLSRALKGFFREKECFVMERIPWTIEGS